MDDGGHAIYLEWHQNNVTLRVRSCDTELGRNFELFLL